MQIYCKESDLIPQKTSIENLVEEKLNRDEEIPDDLFYHWCRKLLYGEAIPEGFPDPWF